MNYIFGFIDLLIVAAISYFMVQPLELTIPWLLAFIICPVILVLGILATKNFYSKKQYMLKDYYTIFESVAVAYSIISAAIFSLGIDPQIIVITAFSAILIFTLMVIIRL